MAEEYFGNRPKLERNLVNVLKKLDVDKFFLVEPYELSLNDLPEKFKAKIGKFSVQVVKDFDSEPDGYGGFAGNYYLIEVYLASIKLHSFSINKELYEELAGRVRSREFNKLDLKREKEEIGRNKKLSGLERQLSDGKPKK